MPDAVSDSHVYVEGGDGYQARSFRARDFLCLDCNATPGCWRQLCENCYRRRSRAGEAMPDSFWHSAPYLLAMIDQAGPSGCWLWMGRRNAQGYGIISLSGRTTGAHRVTYQRLVGTIPPGLELDHLCRNRPCVNPEHLEPVTRTENQRRTPIVVDHCKNGHPWTPENTRWFSAGTSRPPFRRCATCVHAYQNAWKRERRAMGLYK